MKIIKNDKSGKGIDSRSKSIVLSKWIPDKLPHKHISAPRIKMYYSSKKIVSGKIPYLIKNGERHLQKNWRCLSLEYRPKYDYLLI